MNSNINRIFKIFFLKHWEEEKRKIRTQQVFSSLTIIFTCKIFNIQKLIENKLFKFIALRKNIMILDKRF